MSILVITWNFPPRRGGIENVISQVVTGLRKRHPVTVITRHARTGNSHGNDIFRAPCPGVIPFVLYAIWRGAWLLHRNREQTVVFGGSALVAPVVLILARLFGQKAVVQTHGLDIIYANALYRFLCVRWLKHCERIIANSTYTAALARSAGVPEDRVTVIFPGIDAQRFAVSQDLDGVKSKLGFDAKPITLFVGRLAKRKGIKEFIEKSFVHVSREIPTACLAIAGDNPRESLAHRDDTLTGIKEAISQLRLQDHVRLLGSVSDEQLVALYQMADVVVLPALASKEDVEGFGIVLLEAAAAAKPTVATRVGGIPDAVEDGKSGILVQPGDYNELTKALIALLRNDELRKAFGRHGSNRVQETFAWPKIIASYEQALGLDMGSES
ncbi:MAG: glycosyltransferase family 4 protein [Alphaproteobacteria bacterium]